MEPYEGMEPYIFTSYARKDWERVKPFLDALSDAGYRVWYDAGIQAGADWLDTLLEKVENCAVFCPLFSEAFINSRYCSEETKWAYRKQKIIVPLHLEKMTPDGLPRLYELLQGRQDLRLYEYADAAQFAERLGRENAFAPCKVPEWHKVGQIQWRLSADGVLTIAKNEDRPNFWSGTSVPDYQIEPHGGSTAPWMPYRKKIVSVAIEDDIKAIGTNAFYDCENLTKVVMGGDVKVIDDGAFFRCRNLTDVLMGNSVNTIGKHAFDLCRSLRNVRISDNVIAIGLCAFARCRNLRVVSIPDSITEIGDYAFASCEKLKNVEIPAETQIGYQTFSEGTCVIRRDAPQ